MSLITLALNVKVPGKDGPRKVRFFNIILSTIKIPRAFPADTVTRVAAFQTSAFQNTAFQTLKTSTSVKGPRLKVR